MIFAFNVRRASLSVAVPRPVKNALPHLNSLTIFIKVKSNSHLMCKTQYIRDDSCPL